jgi:hypothetical protein
MVLRNVNQPDLFKTVLERCHDRLCLPCAKERQAIIEANFTACLTDPPYRFLTLTLRHSNDPLLDQLNRLYRHFRALRRTPYWHDHVTGGAAFCEIKLARDAHSWHPHLHMLIAGVYMDQGDLSDLWHRVTGDSSIVDIRLVRDTRRAAHYVAKYSTKPLPASVIRDPAALAEALPAVAHRRLIVTFGDWRHIRTTAAPDDHTWQLYATESELRHRAYTDDPLARAVLSMLNTADPITGEFTVELDADHLEHPP